MAKCVGVARAILNLELAMSQQDASAAGRSSFMYDLHNATHHTQFSGITGTELHNNLSMSNVSSH